MILRVIEQEIHFPGYETRSKSFQAEEKHY